MPESRVADVVAAPHALSIADTEERWSVGAAHGLSSVEAAARVLVQGCNVIEHTDGTGWLRRVLAPYYNPLIHVLPAAGTVTAVLGEFVDAGVIAGVVVLNAVIGSVQESRATARPRCAVADGARRRGAARRR